MTDKQMTDKDALGIAIHAINLITKSPWILKVFTLHVPTWKKAAQRLTEMSKGSK